MAALDFGMAKARGLIAPSQSYEENVISKAGGRNVFKSEDWWNKQLDVGIKEGSFKEKTTERVSPGVFSGRGGTFDSRVRQKGYESATPVYEERYIKRSRGSGPQYLPIDTPNIDTRRYMVQKNIIGYDAVKTSDITTQVLNKIESATKRRGEVIRGETEKLKKTSKRARRGLGGLVAKAPLPGEKTGALPLLGETGLAGSEVGLGTALNLKG